MNTNSSDIRKSFFDFFAQNNHKIVPSAPMVIKNDPTLMFTNAGMNQFKDYFLGTKVPDVRRIADTQKCLRVSGKHNDLEEVGKDTYHHTMFEMLGNWSFGDYFKENAIEMAWNYLTEELKIPKEKLYVTIFGGAKEDDLGVDLEAKNEWLKFIPEDRILLGSKKDNFWEMGDQGPCGPCTEIHIDIRSDEEKAKIPGADLVNEDHPHVIELWNVVFIQYERKSDGKLYPLPEKHVDTGMGFERLCMILQGKQSNYDTDLFTPIIAAIEKKSGYTYGKEISIDIAMRVISDHVRAISFAITDGQLPSNTGAGYVIRRILRRAVRYGYSFLQIEEPFIHQLVDILVEIYKDVFPELAAQKDFLKKIIKEEEASFLRTLSRGIKRLNALIEESNANISGKDAFELYDTYGFPLDLTVLIASESGLKVDEKEFTVQMKEQKERARSSQSKELSDWTVLNDDNDITFIGYDQLVADAKVLRFRKVEEKKRTFYQVVLDRTPFYAESGGQVGDKGLIFGENEKFEVFDTKKEGDVIMHFVKKWNEETRTVKAEVNKDLRRLTENNHSATHLLHAALREILGPHVTQKGSYVGPDRLRFDFAHFEKISHEDLTKIEQLVNLKIQENIVLGEERSMPFEEAKSKGAMALFGEKYGDNVRVITFDPKYSVELCGGCHVSSTGQIALLKIVSETAIAAGTRRIEALTGPAAVEYCNKHIEQVSEIIQLTKFTGDLVKGIESLMSEKDALKQELVKFKQKEVQAIKKDLLNKTETIKGVNFLAEIVEVSDADSLKELSYGIKNEKKDLFLVLGAKSNGKALINVMISENLTEKHQLHAGNIVKQLAKSIQGGGGGQAFFATAGGAKPEGLPELMINAKAILENIN